MNSPFLRHFLRNLRFSLILTAGASFVLLLYQLATKNPANWQIAIFLGIGMFLSSLLNAFYDSRKGKDESGKA